MCRVSCFVGSSEYALHGTILLGRIRRRQLAPDHSEGSWNSHVCNETLQEGEDGGRTLVAGAVWTLERETLSTNITTQCDPPRDAGKGPAVSMCTSSTSLLARAAVWWAVGARVPFAIEHAEHQTSFPVKRKPFYLAVACNTLVRVWAKEKWRWLTSTTLPCFNIPVFMAAAAKEHSVSKRVSSQTQFPPTQN